MKNGSLSLLLETVPFVLLLHVVSEQVKGIRCSCPSGLLTVRLGVTQMLHEGIAPVFTCMITLLMQPLLLTLLCFQSGAFFSQPEKLHYFITRVLSFQGLTFLFTLHVCRIVLLCMKFQAGRQGFFLCLWLFVWFFWSAQGWCVSPSSDCAVSAVMRANMLTADPSGWCLFPLVAFRCSLDVGLQELAVTYGAVWVFTNVFCLGVTEIRECGLDVADQFGKILGT